MDKVFQYVFPPLIILVGLYLSFKTNVIRDAIVPALTSEGKTRRPYSFARAQIMWWTLIILSIYCIYYGKNDVGIHQPSPNLLALLGISAGTTTLGSLIDSNDMLEKKVRQQDMGANKSGFLADILDDGNGISVHRFQALIFNVTIGFMFISDFVADTTRMPEVSGYQLGLLGISSATYLAIKARENDKPVERNTMASTSSAVTADGKNS
jgi:hypothetical protein